MEIKFVRSSCPDPWNGPGYMVWTDKYTGKFQCVGFTSNKNIKSIKEYFVSEGYYVSVVEEPQVY